jgi:hypothetical protein
VTISGSETAVAFICDRLWGGPPDYRRSLWACPASGPDLGLRLAIACGGEPQLQPRIHVKRFIHVLCGARRDLTPVEAPDGAVSAMSPVKVPSGEGIGHA